MTKLTEKYVQDTALDYLRSFYTNKYKLNKIYVKKEAVVVYKKKRGRADGLLAFKNQENKIHTVSLEAKSHKTFKSLLTEDKNFGFFGLSISGLFISFFVLHFTINNFGWVGKWLIPIALSIIVSFLLIVLFTNFAWFEKHGIIEQVRRYPADEHWIALSKDCFNSYNNVNDNELIYRAKKYNIGILIIGAKQKVDIFLDINVKKIKNNPNNLKYYAISNQCENELT